MKDLKEKLIKFRLSKRLTKVAMAKKLGVSPQLYGYYERGEREPKLEFFTLFKEVFNFDLMKETNSLESTQKTTSQKKEIFKLKRDVLELKQNIVDIEEIMESQEAQLKSLFDRFNRSNAS